MDKVWQHQEQNENLAMELLGWSEMQVAQSTPETIVKALQTHHQHQLEKKKELPPVANVEPIIKLTWPKSQTRATKTCIEMPAAIIHINDGSTMENERHIAPSVTPQMQAQLQGAETSAKLTEGAHDKPCVKTINETSPHSAPTPMSTPTASSCQADFKTSFVNEMSAFSLVGKTPGFLRDQKHDSIVSSIETTSLEERCKTLSARIKELLLRRSDHDVHLANTTLNALQKQRLLESFDRTNHYIWDCMSAIASEKVQIAAEIQYKKALLSWTDVQTSPNVLAELATDIANLSICLNILTNLNLDLCSA